MFRKRNAGKPLAREKVKQWKKALREYDAMTEQDVVGPEEAQSIALLETLEAQQTGLRSLYEDLAQTQEPEAFGKAVMTRLRSQRRAAVNGAKANQKLLENYDELSARGDDLTRQPPFPPEASCQLRHRSGGDPQRPLRLRHESV